MQAHGTQISPQRVAGYSEAVLINPAAGER